jgi:hypothetical protein
MSETHHDKVSWHKASLALEFGLFPFWFLFIVLALRYYTDTTTL